MRAAPWVYSVYTSGENRVRCIESGCIREFGELWLYYWRAGGERGIYTYVCDRVGKYRVYMLFAHMVCASARYCHSIDNFFDVIYRKLLVYRI